MAPTDTEADGKVEQLLRLIDDLPTVPETLIRIWQIVDDPDSTCEALADVVRLDAPLCAKILRLANSPYYTVGNQAIADTRTAISILGFETIKQLAICVSVATNLVREGSRRQGGLDYRALWRHSVAAGVVAKRFAVLTGDPNPEEAFTAGLLHDLGKFALLCAMPGPYAEVVEKRRRDGRTLVELEREAFGFDHAQAGAEFGRAWRFPGLLVEAARRHHDRFSGPSPDERIERMVRLTALAERLAYRVDPPACDLGFDAGGAETGLLLLALDLPPGTADEELLVLRDELARARAYLEIV